MTPEELANCLIYQIGALKGFLDAEEMPLNRNIEHRGSVADRVRHLLASGSHAVERAVRLDVQRRRWRAACGPSARGSRARTVARMCACAPIRLRPFRQTQRRRRCDGGAGGACGLLVRGLSDQRASRSGAPILSRERRSAIHCAEECARLIALPWRYVAVLRAYPPGPMHLVRLLWVTCERGKQRLPLRRLPC